MSLPTSQTRFGVLAYRVPSSVPQDPHWASVQLSIQHPVWMSSLLLTMQMPTVIP